MPRAFWEAVLHAGHEFGLEPFGLEALQATGLLICSYFAKSGCGAATSCKKTYDVVIVGAGVHGLATAYYLGKDHGIRRVALLEKGYLGSGSSGRNTAIIRSNYRTPEGIPVLRRLGEAVRGALARAGLERAVQPVRPPHAGAYRFRGRGPAGARGEQPTARRGQPDRLSR